MDFGGILGMEVLVGSSSCSFSPSLGTSNLESIGKRGLFGSHFLEQGRYGRAEEDDESCPKISRSIPHSRSSNGETMLSFSSSKLSAHMHSSGNPSALAPLQTSSTVIPNGNAGLTSGYLNLSMQRVVGGASELFTHSQRMELEQQVLIYNCIRANAPIPTSLISSFRRSLNLAGFSTCPTASMRPNSGWWGYFHPSFVGNPDPEPYRCRRTDGKKWRCSRDAVPEQKYCERHLNRGRHRSRKHVEGHAGHAKKTMPNITSSTSVSAVSSGSLSSNSLTVSKHQKSTHAAPPQSWTLDGSNTVKDYVDSAEDQSILTTKPFESLFPTTRNYNPLDGTSSLQVDSGNAFLSQLSGTFVANNSLVSPLELNENQSKQPHILGHFVEEWNPSQSDCSVIVWSDAEEKKSEKTPLSAPFLMASSDFSSSTSSPIQDRQSPLGIGLGLGGIATESNSMHMNWRSAPWEVRTGASASRGGPLGEALASTSSTLTDENKSFLRLMNDGWDLSPPFASSTDKALLSTTLSSVSCSSAKHGFVENNTNEVLGSLFDSENANSSTLFKHLPK
ncbi:hypothetical protein HPP92_018774 [Vanilla planifolia]|uniref:Growth-regulating factor n=1 Tax=Vanilla planifolia TaxID=51239 RepID=A0A835Q7M0_VANPL|nr:hypothetical protein HPP92_018774 [Vanilla planifolia]